MPAARNRHTAVWSPAADGMYVFGGFSTISNSRVLSQSNGCTARFDGAEPNGAMETVLVRQARRSAVLRPPGREQDRVWWGPDGYSGWHGYMFSCRFPQKL